MKRIFFITFIAALILAACGPRAQANQPQGFLDLAEPGYGGGAAPEAPPMSESFAGEDESRGLGNVEGAVIDRIVIKNADLSIVVEDVEARMQAIQRMAEEMGGRLVSSNVSQTFASNGAKVPEGMMVIRVPSEKLDEALKEIKAGVVEVQYETVSSQDVTSDYVDLQSRLKNLEAAEAQLVRILEEAQDTEDVLNVFNQLTSIREQIEVVKGQIKYYDESASLSAISIYIIAQEKVQPIQIGPWTPQGAISDAIQDLVYFWQDFVEFFIYFVLNFIPKLLLIALVYGLPLWLIARAMRNAWRKRREAQVASAPAAKAKK